MVSLQEPKIYVGWEMRGSSGASSKAVSSDDSLTGIQTFSVLRSTVASNRPMQCKISCRVVSSDKGLMIQQLNARRDATGRLSVAPAISENGDTIEQQNPAARLSVPDEGEDDSLPPVKELVPDNTWITIESGTRYETAEKMSRSKSAFSKGNGLWEDGVGVLYV
jgi:hypothetical protein